MFLVRRVIGVSMLPVLKPGSIVFGVTRKRPKMGDIVIAQKDDIEIIKRVASQSSEGLFLLGDNPSASTDSRVYGWFPKKAISAVVIGRLK